MSIVVTIQKLIGRGSTAPEGRRPRTGIVRDLPSSFPIPCGCGEGVMIGIRKTLANNQGILLGKECSRCRCFRVESSEGGWGR